MSRTHFTLPNWNHVDTLSVGVPKLHCVAEGWTGSSIAGHLVDFNPELKSLVLKTDEAERNVTLKFNQLKRLKVDSHPETDIDFLPTAFPGATEPRPFVVHLRDGAMFSGIAHAQQQQPYGLWVFPKKTLDNDPFRVFIPRSGIQSFEFKGSGLSSTTARDFDQSVVSELEGLELEEALGGKTSMVENTEQLIKALDNQNKLKPVPIGEALLGLGKITTAQLADALVQQRQKKTKPLGQMLIDMGLISTNDLQTAFARKMGYPFVDLKKFPVEVSALRCVPMSMANRLKVLPLVNLKSALVVAMQDPLQFKVIEELEFTSQRKVIPVVTTSDELVGQIAKAYREIGMGDARTEPLPEARAAAEAEAGGDAMDAFMLAVELQGEAKDSPVDDVVVEQSDNTLVKLINSMITEAYYQRASDIHIEPYPGREKLVIRFRVDGEMRPYLELPSGYRNALIARIKVMCDLDISERRRPQDGKINFAKFGGLNIELRVATIPTANGMEDVVMRILSSFKPLPMDQLRLSPANMAAFQRIVQLPYGLFLCAGPTGSGKTTTLHSALQAINTPNRKIWTAEDPVEITQRGLRQIQVNHKIGWTFATALRSLLRADPDVIMVGEVRDHETAEMCIEAALTGHLVLSTLHTNSAAETIVRLIDLGVDPFSFADSLQGILAQRLVKAFCTSCVQREPVKEALLQELVSDFQFSLPLDHPWRDTELLLNDWQQRLGINGVLHVSHAAGCDKCNQTGFRGRLALHEMLVSTPQIRLLIQNRGRPHELQAMAIAEGMRTLRQDGIEKVLQGLTSLTEVRASSNA